MQFGLTTNLRNLKWYEEADHYTFFPRSHLLGSDDEKMDFIGMPMEVLIKFCLCGDDCTLSLFFTLKFATNAPARCFDLLNNLLYANKSKKCDPVISVQHLSLYSRVVREVQNSIKKYIHTVGQRGLSFNLTR